MVRWKLIFLFLLLNFSIHAQKHLIADVQFNKSAVYVGEPVKVQVSIFTSTWFTTGVNPGNIKVNGAFTVYFRSLSISKQINGQTYSGVVMYFNVFPYEDNDLVFPALEFTVETPDKGGFDGIKRVVRTAQKSIRVRSVPSGIDREDWLVTSNMTINDRWSGDKNNVKVGDVLERRITRNVAGTVSELIPPIKWDTIPNVSLYATRSEVKNNKTKTAISASRTDGTRYLFEKEGTVIVPEMVLSWWNQNSKQLFKRTLKGYTIEVKPNPDLGMLETMRDSLQVALPLESDAVEEVSPKTILGFSPKEFLVLLICLTLGCYLLYYFGKRIYRILKSRKQIFMASEAYFFKRFLSASQGGNSVKMINALYVWIDKLKLKEPTLESFVSSYGNETLATDLNSIKAASNGDSSLKLNIKLWIKARKVYLKAIHKNPAEGSSNNWINP